MPCLFNYLNTRDFSPDCKERLKKVAATALPILLGLISSACTNKFSHPLTPAPIAAHKAAAPTPALPDAQRIVLVENNTLHILDEQGEPIPGFQPITGVAPGVKATTRFIAYRDQVTDVLHVTDTQGNPISGFHPDRVKLFSLSNQAIVYTDQEDHLHVLNSEGSHIPGFAPSIHIQVTEGIGVSDTVIAYLEDTGDEAHPRSLIVLNAMGQPIPGIQRIPDVVSVQVSDRFVAYTTHPEDDVEGPRTLHILTPQLRPGLEFEPIENVHAFAVSNTGITCISGADRQLRVFNAQGQEIPGFARFQNVTQVRISNQQIAFTIQRGHTQTLRILNFFGHTMPNFRQIRNVVHFDISDRHVFFRESAFLGTHVLDTGGKILRSWMDHPSVSLPY